MPKKYKEPSLNKEKLSNKSLVAGRLCPKNSPIIIEDAYIPCTSFETQRDSIDIDIQLLSSTIKRQTPNKKNVADYAMKSAEKQGIILEEQNESMYNSSNQNSVSEGDESESDDSSKTQKFNMNLKKTVSNPITLNSRLIQGDNNLIKDILTKLNKKESVLCTNNNKLDAPKRESNAHSACYNSNNNINSELINNGIISPESCINSTAHHRRPQSNFQTDLNVLKNVDQTQKSRAVMSRLKMMI